MNCAATIVREEGLRGLWSGASPTVLRNGTNQMCLFWAKNHMDSVMWGAWPRHLPIRDLRNCACVMRGGALLVFLHALPA